MVDSQRHGSERNQYEKAIDCMIPTMWRSGKGKIKKTVKRSVVDIGMGIVRLLLYKSSIGSLRAQETCFVF